MDKKGLCHACLGTWPRGAGKQVAPVMARQGGDVLRGRALPFPSSGEEARKRYQRERETRISASRWAKARPAALGTCGRTSRRPPSARITVPLGVRTAYPPLERPSDRHARRLGRQGLGLDLDGEVVDPVALLQRGPYPTDHGRTGTVVAGSCVVWIDLPDLPCGAEPYGSARSWPHPERAGLRPLRWRPRGRRGSEPAGPPCTGDVPRLRSMFRLG